MADWKLRLYHKLPPFLRNVAASYRGLQLQNWRYGPQTDQLAAEALERDTWSPQQWKKYQEDQLGLLLHRAATKVPYYRDLWVNRRRQGDQSGWDYLENWPILDKEPLRESPHAFLLDDASPSTMFHTHTSGTTGKPIHLYWTRADLQQWYALFEARWRRWYGLSRHNRWAILGGQLIAPVSQNKPPFWSWNHAMNQLYMSSYHLAPQHISAYVEAIRKHEIEYIYCYSSSGYAIAEEMLRSGIESPPLKAVLTNAEPLYDYQREAMSKAFRCPVHETYSLSEAVIGASECDHGKLHLWADAGVCELIEDGVTAMAGESGEIIATGFVNRSMPLIRYRTGDRAVYSPKGNDPCECGRSLPRLDQVDGRSDDVLVTPSGRRIGRLDPVFKADFPIHEAQIVQQQLDHLLVRVVPAPGYSASVETEIAARLRERMGDIRVDFEQLDAIPRTSNGKFRAVISNLSSEERARMESK